MNGQLPTVLDGVSVTVGGKPAYINYISPTQINAVAPDVGAGSVSVTVNNNGAISTPAKLTALSTQPGFFLWPGGYAVATRQDYTWAVKNGAFPDVATTAAKPGDLLILWGTGFDATAPIAPSGVQIPATQTFPDGVATIVTIGGNATVYGAALAPGFAGLYQIAIEGPTGLAAGDYPIIATVNGASSASSALLTIQP